MVSKHHVLLHLEGGRRIPVAPAQVAYLKAREDQTSVRTTHRGTLLDIRPLRQVVDFFPSRGFVIVHREFAVNSDHVSEIRLRECGTEWELKLAPPVNRVIPIDRSCLDQVWAAFGE